ncbi:hypothetical protein BDV98DRAFT_366847 [Pterulicium gracile]|uniref:F-box domain-containing protein n=1 Tax=Pterulicium gracile TaxID=1884261 RepID=A0A5C3QQK2_9AGAR|nr:hypothetical protein BDV98DRAFT_366847 [Pterula gracilis]
MTAHINQTADVIHNNRSHLTPVHRLPNDVLLLIFGYLTGRSNKGWGYPLFAVTGVCQRWRDFALACPDLWADVVFAPKDGGASEDQTRSEKERLELQLARAGVLGPLEIMLDLSHFPPESPHDGCLNPDNTAFETVLSFIHRASRLELHGKLPSRWTVSPSWMNYTDNRLRIFRFMTNSSSPRSPGSQARPFAPHASSPISLSTTSASMRALASLSTPSKGSDLCFASSPPASILEVLVLTRGSLRELEIRHYEGRSDPGPSFYRVPSHTAAVLPHLRRLSLAYISDLRKLTMQTVLAHLRAPQLEVLRFAGLHSSSDLIVARQFIQASGNTIHLEELAIKDVKKLGASCTELIELLSEVTALQRLSVDRLAGNGDHNALILALCRRSSVEALSQSLLGHENDLRQ